MPNLFQLLLGLLTLLFVVCRTTIKANELRKMEIMANNVQHVTNLSILHEEIDASDASSVSIVASSTSSFASSSNGPKTLHPVSILKEVPVVEGEIIYPWTIIRYVMLMMTAFILLMALGATFGICSAGFFSFYILSFIPLGVILHFVFRQLRYEQEERISRTLPGDLNLMTMSNIPLYIAFFIGVISAVIGIGGNLLFKNLFLLDFTF